MSEVCGDSIKLSESTKYQLQQVSMQESSTRVPEPERGEKENGDLTDNPKESNKTSALNQGTPNVDETHLPPEVPELTSTERVREWLEQNFEKKDENAVYLTPIKRQVMEPPRP